MVRHWQATAKAVTFLIGSTIPVPRVYTAQDLHMLLTYKERPPVLSVDKMRIQTCTQEEKPKQTLYWTSGKENVPF